MKKYKEMTNEEIKDIKFDECPKRCVAYRSDCADTCVGDCRKHLSEKFDSK